MWQTHRNRSEEALTSRSFSEIDLHDPHHFLGLHLIGEGRKVIRLWRPGAQECHIELLGKLVKVARKEESGLFEMEVVSTIGPWDYKVFHQNGLLDFDPYIFLPTWGEMDSHLFSQGVHYRAYDVLGAHPVSHQGVMGVKFAVWAPQAKAVSLVGDFNYWNGKMNPMRSMGASGVWELFVPGLKTGERYKFEIRTKTGDLRIKADPYAFFQEVRPKTASVVAEVDSYAWQDQAWMERRKEGQDRGPLNIYEVHLSSWKRKEGKYLNYRELAVELASYAKEMGYTHVELMPILEHPLDESWGYQVTGYFAVSSRLGSPADFQFFVDFMHQSGIGVILDWVPAHFPTDDFSLARFDGTALYEHEDPRQGYHPHWHTYIFNYGRKEVANFLMASALFWLGKMHVDGLRVDAVASMLYLDYGREEGEWIPNRYGGKENLEAIEFLKHLNSIVHEREPGVLMIAEESTSFTGVTHPLQSGGLGFDLKWNMGWMNDTLRYMQKDPIYRGYHHNDLTFGLLYAFSERFILVLSHDEVVHGKKSLLSKMPGDLWQQFANLRLLLSYMLCQPGKKMLFMGGEIGQWNEWWCREELHWNLLDFPKHKGVQLMVKELNRLYLTHSPLWEKDFHHSTFEWVNFSDTQNSVISYKRKGEAYDLLCVHNFTPNFYDHYFLPVEGEVKEIFNSDADQYGGSGKENSSPRYKPGGVEIALSPLATMIFRLS